MPELEPLSEFFWTSGAEGILRIQHCDACGHWQHPPLVRCMKCHSADLAPQPVSGRGKVVSWTVNQQAWQKGMEEPFIFAVIGLAEKTELYVFTNLLCAPEEAVSGMEVAVEFEQNEDVWLPLFRPIEASANA